VYAVRDRRLAAALVCAAFALTACAKAPSVAEDGFNGSEPSNPYDAPATQLRDTDGTAYSLTEQTTKPVTLVFFGFTNCPDICNMVMANITQSLLRLDEDDRDDVDVVFVTTDPARDDGPTLRRYLDAYDDGFIGLTGKLDDLVTVGDAFHVFMEREAKLPTGGYDVTHTTHVFAVDSSDQVPVLWSRETTPAQLAADLHLLLHPKS
jgi:protein SCO1/2